MNLLKILFSYYKKGLKCFLKLTFNFLAVAKVSWSMETISLLAKFSMRSWGKPEKEVALKRLNWFPASRKPRRAGIAPNAPPLPLLLSPLKAFPVKAFSPKSNVFRVAAKGARAAAGTDLSLLAAKEKSRTETLVALEKRSLE